MDADLSHVTQEYRREMLAMCDYCQSLRIVLQQVENGCYFFAGQQARKEARGFLADDEELGAKMCLPFVRDGAPPANGVLSQRSFHKSNLAAHPTPECSPSYLHTRKMHHNAPSEKVALCQHCTAARETKDTHAVPHTREGERQSGSPGTYSRRVLEEAVLLEMSDHPTIMYIKELEVERDRYKLLFQSEVKKYNELRVAFRAQRRNNK